jgi:hypothetical protein
MKRARPFDGYWATAFCVRLLPVVIVWGRVWIGQNVAESVAARSYALKSFGMKLAERVGFDNRELCYLSSSE